MTTAVEKIATALDEKEEMPLAEIERVVKVLGDERALTILEQTMKIEAEGGMMTDDGTRRRTAGGVFFKLVKNETTPKERGKIFGARPGASPKPITWEESEQLSNEALELPQGEIDKVKITIIGRPGRVIEKDMVVITSMQTSKVPNLPKGLPKPPGDLTTYVVYMAMKQWLRVKDSINENSDDVLIIDGYPLFDKRIGQAGAMTIYAQNVTSKLVQQARRDAQRAGAKKE